MCNIVFGLLCCFTIIHKTTVVESLPSGLGFSPQHFPEEKGEGKYRMWLCQALLSAAMEGEPGL